MPLTSLLKRAANALLGPFGVEMRRRQPPADPPPPPRWEDVYRGTGSYPDYVDQAAEHGVDVNDWLEQGLGWPPILPHLEEALFPYLPSDAHACELGVGTGRAARLVLQQLGDGALYLVDFSPWFVEFLTGYFAGDPRVHVHHNDGYSLPMRETAFLDLAYSFGTFLALNPGYFHLYAHEFARVLKPGGHAVLEYLEITRPEGWAFLEANMQVPDRDLATVYTGYPPEVVERIFAGAGFEPVTHRRRADYPYTIFVARYTGGVASGTI